MEYKFVGDDYVGRPFVHIQRQGIAGNTVVLSRKDAAKLVDLLQRALSVGEGVGLENAFDEEEPLRVFVDPNKFLVKDEPLHKQSFQDVVDEMLKTRKARNEVYKDNYITSAELLPILFPNGVKFGNLVDDCKFVIMMAMIGKMVRYCTAMPHGHADSAHDNGIYSIILEMLHDRSER